MGCLVPYHAMCCDNITESARDRPLVCITLSYECLKTCHGCRFEQEPIFSYTSRALIDKTHSGLWILSYTERVLRLCSAELMEVYAE